MIIAMDFQPNIPSKVWINSLTDNSDDAEIEMADGVAVAEATDEDEVAVHFTLVGESQSLVSVYMTRVGALALALELQVEVTRKIEFGVPLDG